MWLLLPFLLLSIPYATFGDKDIDKDKRGQLRIINGTYTSIEEIPWQVAQVVPQSNGHEKLVCGGSIVNMNKILTAAHCIKHAPAPALKKSFYRAGSSYYDRGGSTHHIHSYVVHPKFSAQEGLNFHIQNDIAVVRVKEPFIYSPAIKPIALHDKLPSNLVKAQISGWGITNPFILNSTAPHLLSDKITVLKPKKCLKVLGINILNLPKNFFCMGEKNGGKGGCFGDSGGPVTINKKLVGIISAAINIRTQEESGKLYACGFKMSATIVQSVAPFLKWVHDSMLYLDKLP